MDDIFQQLLNRVLPHMTSRRVGRLTDKSHRVAQKWFSGEMTVPPDVEAAVQAQADLLRNSQFPERLSTAVDDATAAGIHPEIIASHLAEEYRRVTGLEIE